MIGIYDLKEKNKIIIGYVIKLNPIKCIILK